MQVSLMKFIDVKVESFLLADDSSAFLPPSPRKSLSDAPSFLIDVPLVHLSFLDLAKVYAFHRQVMPPWSCLHDFHFVAAA